MSIGRQTSWTNINELARREQLATSTLWERAELKKIHEAIVRIALPVDSLTIEENDSAIVDSLGLEAVVRAAKESLIDHRPSQNPPQPQEIVESVRQMRNDCCMGGERLREYMRRNRPVKCVNLQRKLLNATTSRPKKKD